MKLIDEWRECWTWLSVQANTIGMAVSSAYAAMYDQLKDTIPPSYMAWITAFIFLLGIIGRLMNQQSSAQTTKE